MRRAPLFVLAVLAVSASLGFVRSPATPFSAFVDAYFDSLFAFTPSFATASGVHDYDTRIEDRSTPAITQRVSTLRRQLAQLDALRRGSLSSDDSIDAAMIDGAIRSELLDEDVIRTWWKNPMLYVQLAGNAVDLLMKRAFAPPVARLDAVTARLRGVPSLVAAMRANVVDPPPEFTKIAIDITDGSTGFFRDDVARWAKEAAGGDQDALRRFTAANDSVVKSLESASAWLKELLPRSHGSFAIGAPAFADKLRYDEMVDIPLSRLLTLGEARLARDRAAFIATAQQIAPGRDPKDAMAALEADHPAAANLLDWTKATLERTRAFLVDHQIVDIPSEVRPIVAETPPYERIGTFASMDTPGAYEAKATEAFYYVTPVEADWDSTHALEHLRLYNRSVLDLITIHEAFPGHYIQFLYAKQFPTKTRKLLAANTNVEGWAHYGEQMMIEEGYGNGDAKLHLAQLSEALLRDCRWVVGIKEHTQGLTVEQGAKQYFEEQCFQQPANAFEEARRGTYDPTYLYYALGKLEIYKLRADYQKAMGKGFSLKRFHDEFVKQGGVPIKLIRRIMLPGDTAAVLE